MNIRHTIIPSPIGPLLLLASDIGLTGLYMSKNAPSPQEHPDWIEDPAPFKECRSQLDAYFKGRLRKFNLSLDLQGTPFQKQVWLALTEIPYGKTLTYGEQARKIGNPNATRAVGLANGRNPVSIVVPCHRVIGANGTLTGFGGGLERKRFLLNLEQGGELIF